MGIGRTQNMVDYKDKYYGKQKFYNFEFTQHKWGVAQNKFQTMTRKHFFRGIIFGFCVEMLIINTSIYGNSVKKSTNRRLENKLIEERYLKEREELSQSSKALPENPLTRGRM